MYHCLKLITIIFVFMSVGCQTVPPTPPPTASITGKSLEDVKGVVINVYAADGWRLDKDTNYQLVFLKQVDPTSFAAMMLSSRYDSTVYYRERITMSKVGDSITLRPQQEIVTNYGSAFERTTPVNNYPFTVRRFYSIESALR